MKEKQCSREKLKPPNRIGLKIYKEKEEKIKVGRFFLVKVLSVNSYVLLETTSLGFSVYKSINEAVDEMSLDFISVLTVLYFLLKWNF